MSTRPVYLGVLHGARNVDGVFVSQRDGMRVYVLTGKTAHEMHLAKMTAYDERMKQATMTDEQRRVAEGRFSLITDWIKSGRVATVYDEGDRKMFYRTVNGYEFGSEYVYDGAVFAMVALAVHAAGGT